VPSIVTPVSELGFGKNRRLLGASDFQLVFKQARYKVSCQYLLLLALPANGPYSRVGLVVAKKNVRFAVERNRVKRILRESFRHNQGLLPTVDIVILVRSGIGTLSNEDLRKKIDKLWRDLILKSGRSMPCEAK